MAEARRSSGRGPADLDAWELCLRALPLVRRRTAAGMSAGRELFQQALALRPDYADAHAGLAMSYNMEILIGAAEDRIATATLAMQAAQVAIECDEASSFAHHELSTAFQWLNRIDDALAEAHVAVELNPNDAYALHALGNKSDLAGDPDGITRMEKAQELNPADARLHAHLTFLARAYVNAGAHAAAVDCARSAIRRESGYAPAHYILAIALAYLGRIGEARQAVQHCEMASPGFIESRRDWRPYVNPASNARLHEGIRKIMLEPNSE
jgi:adenylate cyclase